MTAVGSIMLVGLLMLCVGVLLGATWTVQALDRDPDIWRSNARN